MSNENKSVSVNFPLFGILGLIFITLKLTGYIAWSWWWVLSPFWIPFALVLGIFVLALIGVTGATALSDRKRKQKLKQSNKDKL